MEHKFNDNNVAFSLVRDILLSGKSVTVSVKGNSMLPFYKSGSKVTIFPADDNCFKKYSVVFADAGGHFVIHRIISVNGNRATLLGDGNIVGTETMTKDNIYGYIKCSSIHIFLAKIWLFLRPFRRYPLAILRRIM